MKGLDFSGLFLDKVILPEGARILDAGCGNGQCTRFFAEKGFTAVGIDRDADDGDNAGILRADIRNMPFCRGAFDAVFIQCVLSVCGGVEEAFGEANRVLKDGGILFIADVTISPDSAVLRSLTPQEIPESLMTLDEMEKCMQTAGFALDFLQDKTQDLKQYWLERLWMGEDACAISYGPGISPKDLHYSVLTAKKN